MDTHPIESLMKSTLENIKDMIDVNTIVGNAMESKDGSLIIPVSKVSFGFASGGSELPTKESSEKSPNYPFGGGSGAGISVKPVAFLVIRNDSIRLLPVNPQNTYDKIVDTVPQILDMIKGMKPSKCSEKETSDKE